MADPEKFLLIDPISTADAAAAAAQVPTIVALSTGLKSDAASVSPSGNTSSAPALPVEQPLHGEESHFTLRKCLLHRLRNLASPQRPPTAATTANGPSRGNTAGRTSSASNGIAASRATSASTAAAAQVPSQSQASGRDRQSSPTPNPGAESDFDKLEREFSDDQESLRCEIAVKNLLNLLRVFTFH